MIPSTSLDHLTSAPDLVANAAKIKCPVLFIRGDQEPIENYPAERFKENCAGPCEVVVVPNYDHFYVGTDLNGHFKTGGSGFKE